jgi:hypothetical protein
MNFCETNTQLNWDGNRLSHAYIVSGKLADTIAMATVCSSRGETKPCLKCTHCDKAARHIHPDIIIVDKAPDKREIMVDQLRELKKDVIVVPNDAEKKAYIINDADSMNINAQNAFLQILEEPPRHVVFVLRTDNPAALLPTVRSRCVSLYLRHDPEIPGSAAMETANEFFSAIERGNVPLTEFMFQLEKLDKDAFTEFLAAAREYTALSLRAAAPGKAGLSFEILSRVDRILVRAGEMFDLNVGAGHISGMICANLLSIENG